jgi:hypothetical protein
MARITVGQLPRILNVVFLHQVSPQGKLVLGWFVIGPENILASSDVVLRMLMAINTPAHVKRVGTPSERHVSNRAMTRGASNTLIDVNAVVKIRKLGKGVNSRPLQ